MLQKCSQWRVASVFFDNPEKKFELIEISRKINLAHTSVKNHLTNLLKLNIINKSNVEFGNKKNPCYYANKRNSDFIHYKKIYNIECINNSGILKYIIEKCQPNSIVLFGSFQKAEDNLSSDIDIFIESNEVDLNLTRYENKLNRKIQLHFKQFFTDYPDELKNNIINGDILYGYLEVYYA